MCYEAETAGLTVDGYVNGNHGLHFYLNSYNTDFEQFIADYFHILKNFTPKEDIFEVKRKNIERGLKNSLFAEPSQRMIGVMN